MSDRHVTCGNCGSRDTTHWALVHDIEYRTSDTAWEYRKCSSCGVLYLADPPVDRLAEIYPANYYSYTDGTASLAERVKARLDRRMLARFLGAVPGERLRVVDIGGGTGWLASVARDADRRVAETIVVDLDPACAPAAEQAGHRFRLGRIEDTALDDVDAVLMLNLVEHLAHPVDTLARLRDALRPRGRVLIKTPNIDSLDARWFRTKDWGGYHCPRHFVLFDPPSFRASAERAGLSVVSDELTQGAPFWAVSIFGRLEARGLVRRREGQAIHEHGLYSPLTAAAAAFDFARRPFAKTSQMFVILERTPD